MPEDLCVCVELQVYLGWALHSWVSDNECMCYCVLCLNLGAPKADNSHTHHIHMHGLCTVIVCTIGLHVPIGVMACTLITCLWSVLLLKQPWVWTWIVSGYFLVRTTSMSCGARLTAVAVGLSIVAFDDEEVKTPASMACSHSREFYCCELPEAIFVSEWQCLHW